MLKPYKIQRYCEEYHPEWTIEMPDGCPPEDVDVPVNHPFYRLSKRSEGYDEEDFKTYAELDPDRNWGEKLPLAVGLSLIDNESKARRNLKLPFFRHYSGILYLELNPIDGVVKQTGNHHSHYTWWRTKSFDMSNVQSIKL